MRAVFLRILIQAASALSLVLAMCLHESVADTGSFDWQPVPESSVLRPESPYTSERFHLLDCEGSTIRVSFRGPEDFGSFPGRADRSRCVVVTPAGGISSASFEAGRRVFMKGVEEVFPETPPGDPQGEKRLTQKNLGQYRGAELVLVEFRPAVRPKVRTAADAIWIPDATIVLHLKQPFGARQPISPLAQEAMEAVALNGSELSRCLQSPEGENWVDGERRESWENPSLKIRTREEGWTSIPARRLLTEWSRDLELEDLSLLARGELVHLPRKWRPTEDNVPSLDRPRSLFTVTSEGAWKTHGRLDISDRIVFFADRSASPFDPLSCYWLVRGGSRVSELPSPVSGTAQLRDVTTSFFQVALGEDKEFVSGGLKTEKQRYFWVDRSFPSNATEGVRIGLPNWVLTHPEGVEAKLRVLLPSVSPREYVPAGAIRKGSLRLEIDSREVDYDLARSPSGYGQDVLFTLPGDIKSATVAAFYTPSSPTQDDLYVDELILQTTREMVWSGENCAFRFPAPTTGTFRIAVGRGLPEDGGKTPLPRLAIGKTASGEWIPLEPDGEEKSLECRTTVPLVALHLLDGENWQSPESLKRFSLPAWLEAPQSADQLVISPKLFQPQTELISRVNSDCGFSSSWIDLEEIFDVFGGGQFSPFALRNFLAWVSLTWPHPQPISVLLVGDSSWDTWGRFPHSSQVPNWTPSYHTPRDADYPSDLWFVEGLPDDKVADWFFGRIPCQNLDHLDGYLAKRYAFEKEPRTEWSRRLLWVSDDNSPVGEHSEEVFEKTLPFSLRLKHIQIRDYPFVDNFYYGVHLAGIQDKAKKDKRPLDYGKISPECIRAVLNAISEGDSVFVYYGHSGPNVLAHERILFGGGSIYSDVPKLRNGGKAPLCLLMTCDVGRFDFAEMAKWSVGLAEELLFFPAGGCLALVTSTGRGFSSDHQDFLLGSFDALFNKGVHHCGPMVWAAKVRCLAPDGNNSTIDMFTLFGDPLFAPPLPARSFRAQPEGLRWNPDGSLEIEVGFPVLADLPNEATPLHVNGWQIGPQFTENWYWKSLPLSEKREVDFTLPDAKDLQKVIIGCEIVQTEEGKKEDLLGVSVFGVDLESLNRPDWNSLAGEGLPNLTLGPDSVAFENYTPRSGETTFIDARVRNAGEGAAENVEVVAYENDEPVPSFAEYPPTTIRRLMPGEERSVRIRWDRWAGTGTRTVTIEVDPNDAIAESNEGDNSVSMALQVLSKPDLAWGLVRDSTAGAVNFSLARPVPRNWILQPETADLRQWAPVRAYLTTVDRGALMPVPLTNFGETVSATCALDISFFREGEAKPLIEPLRMRIPPVWPATEEEGEIKGKKVEVLLLPGISRVELNLDPEGLVDETNSDNNRLSVILPKLFWEGFPTLKPEIRPEKAVKPIEVR